MFKMRIIIIVLLTLGLILSAPFEGLMLIASMGGGQNNNDKYCS